MSAATIDLKKYRRLSRAARNLVEILLVGEHVGIDLAALIKHAHAVEREIRMKPRCRRCSCTEDRACPGGCSWVQIGLCSRCDPS